MKIKGQREGVVIQLDEGCWNEQRDTLMNHIRTKERFFFGSKIAVDVGKAEWSADNLSRLITDLQQHDIGLWGLFSDSEISRENAKSIGIHHTEQFEEQGILIKNSGSSAIGSRSIFYFEKLKRGDNLEADANLVILGDVPSGARVVSSANILIWGYLLGSAYAGCDGDAKAIISALGMQFESLQIAAFSASKPSKKMRKVAITAHMVDGSLTFSAWKKEIPRHDV